MVTMSTVGYGDIICTTSIGRFFQILFLGVGLVSPSQFYRQKRQHLRMWPRLKRTNRLTQSCCLFGPPSLYDHVVSGVVQPFFIISVTSSCRAPRALSIISFLYQSGPLGWSWQAQCLLTFRLSNFVPDSWRTAATRPTSPTGRNSVTGTVSTSSWSQCPQLAMATFTVSPP